MMKINCLIIEDELPNANRLEKLLAQTDFEINVLEKTATIKQTVKWLSENPKPDLLLLDIRLSDGISFDIFKAIQIDIPIIFTTAYDQYALQAFKVNSVDYLLKPIRLEELNGALHKFAKNQIAKPDTDLIRLLGSLNQEKPSYRGRFLVSFREQLIPITTDDVGYFISQNKVTYLVSKTGERYILEMTMERLEEELDPKRFFRATRQLIIRQECIAKIVNHFNGKIKLELKPKFEDEVLLSRDKSAALKEWLDQ